MKFSLLVLTPGKQEGKSIEIKLAQFLIGRDPQCHLRPASPLISKRHCALIQRDGKAFIRDFDSTNGTLLNDRPIDGEAELHHDDRLKIGPLFFAVQLEQTTPVSRPTPAPPTKAPPPAANTPAGDGQASPASKPGQPAKGAAPAKPGAKPSPTVSSPTPPPATAPAAKAAPAPASPPASATGEEDDIAAMLLSLEGEGPTTVSGSHEPLPNIPDGSTVMELKLPQEVLDGEAPKPEASKGDTEKAKDKAKASMGNTSNAAKSILEKMMKRPRG